MAIEGRSDAGRAAGSGSAWSAAAKAPSSARCIASPPGMDDHYELVAGALSVDARKVRAAQARRSDLAPRPHLRRLRDHGEGRGQARPTGSRRSPSSRRTTCTPRRA